MTLTHGLSRTHPLYSRWRGMRARCANPNHGGYPRYGARGIAVCDRWGNFAAFVEDMASSWPGPGYEIHRLDNDADYAPANCVWLPTEQHRSMPKSAEHRAAIAASHDGRARLSAEQYAEIGRARRARLNIEWLREAYEVRGLTIDEIAKQTKQGRSSVGRAIQREGIGPRGVRTTRRESFPP